MVQFFKGSFLTDRRGILLEFSPTSVFSLWFGVTKAPFLLASLASLRKYFQFRDRKSYE